MLWLLIAVIAFALIFDFINGFHDSANAIATSVATRALPPHVAVIYAGLLNFTGALVGTEVAATIGNGIVEANSIGFSTILCALLSAIAWNLLTWWKGLPSSSSHALIGSLLGAAFISVVSKGSIHWDIVLAKVVLPMISSPLLGIAVGFVVMKILLLICKLPRLSNDHTVFRRLQILSAGFVAFEHGRNDAQKSMGIIALALVLAYPAHAFEVPVWVKLACAIAMGAGTWTGGWRIIKTIGFKLFKLQPVHGFASEMTAASIISVASYFGMPVSTTHVISSAILGVGSADRATDIKWTMFGRIVVAWLLTLPSTFIMAAALMLLCRVFS